MSNYLDLLKRLGSYETVDKILSGDVTSVLTGQDELYSKQSVDTAQYTPLGWEMGMLESTRVNEAAWPIDFFGRGDMIQYPYDLFQPGNTAYIYFLIKDTAQLVVDGNPDSNPMDPNTGRTARTLKRIALYMPPGVKVNYGTKWEDASLGIRKSVGLGKEIISGGLMDALKQVVPRIADSVLGTTDEFKNDMEFSGKKILDPQSALLFKGVNFREFQFDFQLMARNYAETEAIRKIILAFKYAMHPGTGSTPGGAVWDYPEFFDIYLCTPTRKYMFSIINAALTDMEVDYGGSGIPSFFRENGAPVDIRLSLQFKEMLVLTKDQIALNQ